MKTYRVKIPYLTYYVFEVEAESAEEAEEIVNADNCDGQEMDYEEEWEGLAEHEETIVEVA